MADAVGVIDLSHAAYSSEGIKDEEALKKHIMATGTGRSIVMSKDTDWNFDDVDDFADDFAKEMGGLSTVEEVPAVDEAAEAKQKAKEEQEAAAAAALAEQQAQAAALAQAEAKKAAEAAEEALRAAAKAEADAQTAAEIAEAASTAAAEATAVSSSNPDDFGDFFEASTKSGNI